MQRRRRVKWNILAALLYQVVMAVSGLVLPRFVLEYYGSETNGLMQLISQLLGYAVLLEGGVGGVVLAMLYKPLADGDSEAISNVFHDTRRLFGKISWVFAAFSLGLSVVLVWIVDTSFDWLYVMTLVLVLALNVYFNYYFGMAHQLLIRADQKLYVVQLTQSIATAVNVVLCILVMRWGGSIHMVKLTTVLVFLLDPLVYRLYVRRHYQIRPAGQCCGDGLPQKRDAVVHHIAFFIHRNTDVVLLSFFSGVTSASVYSVYNAVILVMENLLGTISSGVAGAVGNMFAREEKRSLETSFELYEACNTVLCMAFSTVAAVMILPFVEIYTAGIRDAQYIQPLFAWLMIGAGLMYCIRMPYGTVVSAASHYQQTRSGAVCEVAINLTVSLLLVKPFGLAGVAMGTFLAMTYRTVYMVWYLSRNILHRPMYLFVVRLMYSLVLCGLLIAAIHVWLPVQAQTLAELIVQAIKVSIVVFPAFAAAELLFGRGLRPAGQKMKTE